jgi:hypothetical protein
MSRRLLYLLALLPQFLFLGFLVAREEWNLAHGQPVLLDLGPYDRGDQLSVSVLNRTLAREPDWEPELQDAIFVLLEAGEPAHRAVAYSRHRPESGLYLEGRVRRVDEDELSVDVHLSHDFASIRAARGADPSRRLQLRVRVREDGSATIETLLVDGEPFKE